MEFPHERIVGRLADGVDPDMAAQRTEMAGDPDLIVEADALIAEEDHQVVGESLMELGNLLIGQRPGQVDVPDLGPDMRRARRDADRLISHVGSMYCIGVLHRHLACQSARAPERCTAKVQLAMSLTMNAPSASGVEKATSVPMILS